MDKSEFLKRASEKPLGQLWVFGIKQAWAALFGGLLLAAFVLTMYVDLPVLSRYDWLFIFAVFVQLFMLVARLEKPHEVITIVLFHLVGLGMELFKTSPGIQSWSYPGDAFFKLGGVPLFSGFMYAAVGSYMARAWRVMQFSFTRYPSRMHTLLFAVAVYINFFTHHYIPDFRVVLFIWLILLYRNVWVGYIVGKRHRSMPLLVGFCLVALFIWLAENIATFTRVWLYPSQLDGWHIVSIHKIGSWLLLMVISFIMVDILYEVRRRIKQRKA